MFFDNSTVYLNLITVLTLNWIEMELFLDAKLNCLK